jgi:hypothetical protein
VPEYGAGSTTSASGSTSPDESPVCGWVRGRAGAARRVVGGLIGLAGFGSGGGASKPGGGTRNLWPHEQTTALPTRRRSRV